MKFKDVKLDMKVISDGPLKIKGVITAIDDKEKSVQVQGKLYRLWFFEDIRNEYDIAYLKEDTNLTFGEMLEYLKQGRKCYRRGWNDKEQYIELGTEISYLTPSGYRINSNHLTMGSKAIVFVGTQGEQVGWFASQADILSNDWAIKPAVKEIVGEK